MGCDIKYLKQIITNTKLRNALIIKQTLAILISSIFLLISISAAQAAISTVDYLVSPGWSNNRKRVVFYNGSRYFLLYNRGTANIYYKSSTDNVTWSGESTLISDGSQYFNVYLISDTKFDLVYYDPNTTTTYVRTCTISGTTISPGSSSAVWNEFNETLAVARSGSGNRIYVIGRDNKNLNAYRADQSGDAQDITSWTQVVNGSDQGGTTNVALVPYQGADKVLWVYTRNQGGTNSDGVYSQVITSSGAEPEAQCGDFNSLPDFSSPIRISDTDFRIIIRPSVAAMEEWTFD